MQKLLYAGHCARPWNVLAAWVTIHGSDMTLGSMKVTIQASSHNILHKYLTLRYEFSISPPQHLLCCCQHSGVYTDPEMATLFSRVVVTIFYVGCPLSHHLLESSLAFESQPKCVLYRVNGYFLHSLVTPASLTALIKM